MKELNRKEQQARSIMLNVFTPALHMYLEYSNPEMYEKWQGNCCRQTAILGAMVLRSILPDYQWTAWDGYFDDILEGHRVKYNHAWIYGINPATGEALLVDLARQHKERLFIRTRANAYPDDHPQYEDMQELKREKLDLDEMMRSTEYYTGMASQHVLNEVVNIMSRALS